MWDELSFFPFSLSSLCFILSHVLSKFIFILLHLSSLFPNLILYFFLSLPYSYIYLSFCFLSPTFSFWSSDSFLISSFLFFPPLLFTVMLSLCLLLLFFNHYPNTSLSPSSSSFYFQLFLTSTEVSVFRHSKNCIFFQLEGTEIENCFCLTKDGSLFQTRKIVALSSNWAQQGLWVSSTVGSQSE